MTVDWTSPVTNRLLIEASGIHRVERWGNMHLQTGKGDNIDALMPGMISRHRQPEPGHRRQPDLPARPRLYNNSWNWNIHYRAAVSYITGSHNFKVGFNNAYLHHENTTYTIPRTVQLQRSPAAFPTQITYRIRRERSR